MKYVIVEFYNYSYNSYNVLEGYAPEDEITFSSHNLMDLFDKLDEINTYINNDFHINLSKKELNFLKEIINDIDGYDKHSFNFRYPCDKKNMPNFQKSFSINILNLAKSFKRVSIILNNFLATIEMLLEEQHEEDEYIDKLCEYKVDYPAEDYTKYFGNDELEQRL